MGTFLTTPKMDPALAARVEASVEGRRGKTAGSWKPRLVGIVRLCVVAAVVSVTWSIVSARRRDRRELDQARESLLAKARAASASLTDDDKAAVTRADSWLARFAGPYEGDLIADDLRARGALAAVLARPTIYVRGPLASLANPEAIAEVAAGSAKDSFLVCLLDPPASKVEKVVLAKVRGLTVTGGGGPVESPTANVRRMADAVMGLPFLLPAWAERVRTAPRIEDVTTLRNAFDRAPIDRAKQAATSGLFVLVLDEPGDGTTPTELDGERAHPVRVGLVDMKASRVLVRLRRRVDPSWVSIPKRPVYSSSLDGCALAFDIREAVTSATGE